LLKVYMELDKSLLSLVPAYYSHEHSNIKIWFEISSLAKMSRETINRVQVISSGRPISSALNSTTPIFRVKIN